MTRPYYGVTAVPDANYKITKACFMKISQGCFNLLVWLSIDSELNLIDRNSYYDLRHCISLCRGITQAA